MQKISSNKFNTKWYVDSGEISTYSAKLCIPPFINTSLYEIGTAGYNVILNLGYKGTILLRFYSKNGHYLSFKISKFKQSFLQNCFNDVVDILVKEPERVLFKTEGAGFYPAVDDMTMIQGMNKRMLTDLKKRRKSRASDEVLSELQYA